MTQSQAILLCLVGFIIAALLYILQPVLTPFVVGIFIAYLADPFADRIEAKGYNRTLATLIVFAVITLVIVAITLLIAPLIVKQLQTLIASLPQIGDWYNAALVPWLQTTLGVDLSGINLKLVTDTVSAEWRQAGGMASKILQYATHSSANLVSMLGLLLMIPVVAFYMLRDFDLVTAKLLDLFPKALQSKVTALAQESNEVLAAFMRGQLLVMLCLGVIYSIGLGLVGLNYALLIGVIAGLASVVPYLGFIVGVGVAMIVGFFQFDSIWLLGLVALVFMIGQVVESFVLTPWLVGDRIGLHPVAVIFAILAGGQLFGFMGVLLALPIAAVVMVLLRNLHSGYINSSLYGDQDQ